VTDPTDTGDTGAPPVSGPAGSAYYVEPPTGPGPGVLLLHSWWGLTDEFRSVANRLAEAGYSVLVPDLHGGETADTPDEAEEILADVDVNTVAALVISSVHTLRALARDAAEPVGVVGFSMGASWAFWLSARAPDAVRAVVGFYGAQSLALDESSPETAYLGHFAEHDELVTEDEVIELLAHLRILNRPTTFHRYPGTAHWFFESDRAPAYDPDAAELAWERTLAFLRERLPAPAPAPPAPAGSG
jgi:carboxymethylenebutenolidase